MRAQPAFAQAPNEICIPQTAENNWHIVLAVILISALIAAHINGGQNRLEDATSSILYEAASVDHKINQNTATPEIPWPDRALTERIARLNLQERVVISTGKKPPLVTIRTELLFSEGDGLLSRAGQYTLNKLFNGLSLPNATVIKLAERTNTEVEFTHGVQMKTLHKQRETSLTEYLNAANLSATIKQ